MIRYYYVKNLSSKCYFVLIAGEDNCSVFQLDFHVHEALTLVPGDLFHIRAIAFLELLACSLYDTFVAQIETFCLLIQLRVFCI